MTIPIILIAFLLLTGAGRSGPTHSRETTSRQQYAQQIQARLAVLQAALPLSKEELLPRYGDGKDDRLLLDMVESRHRIATELALGLSPPQRKQLFDTGTLRLEASALTPAQLALGRQLASHLAWIAFTGIDTGILELRWSPQLEPGTSPPPGGYLHLTIIDLNHGLTAEEQHELHEAVYGEPEEQEK